MNLQQLEYIIALDTHRHFGRAAEACFISQPTLSAMIRKLEDELGTRIFDRSKQPVIPTASGTLLIEQARCVLREANRLQEIADGDREVVAGELRIGIIPTLAPYLLPLFVHDFVKKYPQIKLKVYERITDNLLEQLRKGNIDGAILATPLNKATFREQVLFYEPFLVYSSSPQGKTYLLPEDIDPNQLWLLEEGHCFRSQIANLCELWRQTDPPFEYAAGSIEALKRLVEHRNGITILPQLATQGFSQEQRAMLRSFAPPVPVREVSLVTQRDFLKKRLLNALTEEIQRSLPDDIQLETEVRRMDI